MSQTLEAQWRDQHWTKAEIDIHQLVKEFNQKLKDRNSKSVMMSFLIDAVPTHLLEKYAKQYDKIYVITEQDGFNCLKNVEVCVLPKEYFGSFYLPNIPDHTHITKDFNCFLNRVDPIRQEWFYILYARGLMDRGYVSFNLTLNPDLEYPAQTPLEVFDKYHQTYFTFLDLIKDEIRSIVPFKNFEETGDLFSVVLSTKFSIIVETYFERPDCRALSEKTFRALQLPRPWVLFAATGCVQKLRDLGFDVYDD